MPVQVRNDAQNRFRLTSAKTRKGEPFQDGESFQEGESIQERVIGVAARGVERRTGQQPGDAVPAQPAGGGHPAPLSSHSGDLIARREANVSNAVKRRRFG